jgi:ribosome-associated toxin RatA of RatAB toxin-antitoxin module
MTIISRSSLVLNTPDQMFDLVNDIEAYPLFLPWCKSSHIISKTDEKVVASLTLSKAGLTHSFTTENINIKGETIKIRLVDGPFNHLEGLWQFKPIGNNDGTRVQLDMDFEISNGILVVALGPVFTQISGSLVDAFCKRAQEIYGN